ncbi:multiple antibiotic resistance (MarC)-related protein [Rhodopirellula sp. SWK7]|nr:multiple antibiotic resistance (MarC)-related protein [Rhodopirellula sp. SWK7]
MLLAISMLPLRQSAMKHRRTEEQEAVDKKTIGVVSLGLPLLASPDVVSTAIVFAHPNEGLINHLSMTGVCVALAFCI